MLPKGTVRIRVVKLRSIKNIGTTIPIIKIGFGPEEEPTVELVAV